MNTTPTFEKTVDILVKAYLNDTLAHTTCWACAVGNIVAHHCEYTMVGRKGIGFNWIDKNGKYVFPDWFDVTSMGYSDLRYYRGLAKRQIDCTGYTPSQLAKIEYAFENVSNRNLTDDEWMFDGLMAVVDVLADIHGIDIERKEAAKLLFVKA